MLAVTHTYTLALSHTTHTHTQVRGNGEEEEAKEGVIIEDDVYSGVCGMTASLSFL